MKSTSKDLLNQLKALKDSVPAESSATANLANSKAGAKKVSAGGRSKKIERAEVAAKSSTLSISLSASTARQLNAHTGTGKWTAEAVLSHLVEDMPGAFPEICYEDEVIIPEGLYRRLYRSADRSKLFIAGPTKTFVFEFNPLSKSYKRWERYYRARGLNEIHQPSIEMGVFNLYAFLTSFEDYRADRWVKDIDPLEYMLVR
ncbi:MAG: hypothetical protein MK080_11565 [Opitutales bacterium]|nr:hypothetical protein [Opitutales bacterium]